MTQKITQFDKSTSAAIGKTAVAALREVMAAHGLKIEYRGGSFTGPSFTFKIEAIVEGGETRQEEQWRVDFEFNAPYVGLKKEHFGKEISVGGKSMTIVGFNTRSRAKPVVLKDAAGTTYDAPVKLVQQAIVLAS